MCVDDYYYYKPKRKLRFMYVAFLDILGSFDHLSIIQQQGLQKSSKKHPKTNLLILLHVFRFRILSSTLPQRNIPFLNKLCEDLGQAKLVLLSILDT